MREQGRCGKAHIVLSRAAQVVREARVCLGRCTGVCEWPAQPKWREAGGESMGEGDLSERLVTSLPAFQLTFCRSQQRILQMAIT